MAKARRGGRKPRRRGDQHSALTAAQELFVLTYLQNGYNATAAYAIGHPKAKKNTCAAEGHRLLNDPKIAARIAEEQQARRKRLRMTGDEALTLISMAARADLTQLYDRRGRLRPMAEWPEDVRLAVRSIRPGKNGQAITLHDSLKARHLMALATGAMGARGTASAGVSLADLLSDKTDEELEAQEGGVS